MRTLRVLPEAEEELAQAAAWYEGKRPGLGVELIAVVDRAFEEILEAPMACRTWRDDRPYRRKVLTRLRHRDRFRPAWFGPRHALASTSPQ